MTSVPDTADERGPRVGVGAIIMDGALVLLVKRGRPPAEGLWSVPGGKVEWGESLKRAVEREALEETGLTVEAEEVAGVTEILLPQDQSPPQYHYVLVDYFCRVISGSPEPGDDAAGLRWQRLDRLSELPTTDGLSAKLTSWIAKRNAEPRP